MGNIYNGVAKAISGQDYKTAEFPSMMDGIRGVNFIEKAVQSHHEGNIWKKINDLEN